MPNDPEQNQHILQTLQLQEQHILRLQAQLTAQRAALLMYCRQQQHVGFCDMSLLADDLERLANQQPALSVERTELVSLRAEVQRLKTTVDSSKAKPRSHQ